MKLSKFGLGGIALVTAATLTLAGCASGDSAPSGDTAGGDASAIITVNGGEPQNPLVPADTNETQGGKILDAIFAGLVSYDAEGKPVNDLAESIDTTDSQNFTITIAEGHEFTNGDPVNADSFIDAWNYGAGADRLNSYFFEPIQGYGEGDTLSGLVKVDDYSFTVALSEPLSDFPLRLGYSAFYPLPPAAFEDMAAFGENPIGNGPYMLASEGAWQHNTRIELVKNDDYEGPREAQNGGLTIEFYATLDAAYADLLAGNLDVLDSIPDANYATFESDLGDRAVNQPAAIIQTITIPSDLANFKNPDSFTHWQGEEGQLRREAISMSINRDQITDVIFEGTRTPASDFTSPTIEGWSDSLEGAEVLKYDPDQAKALWAEADAISPFDGVFEIQYNADGGHQAWVDAVANSISNTLGIQAQGNPLPTQAESRTLITERAQTSTAIRTGWQADYPGLFNFLGPIYGTGAGSNDGDYSNPEFDDLLAEGSSAPDADTGNKLYQQAQEILLKDLPAIPLWYQNVVGGYSENVSNVQFDWHSVPLYYEITKG